MGDELCAYACTMWPHSGYSPMFLLKTAWFWFLGGGGGGDTSWVQVHAKCWPYGPRGCRSIFSRTTVMPSISWTLNKRGVHGQKGEMPKASLLQRTRGGHCQSDQETCTVIDSKAMLGNFCGRLSNVHPDHAIWNHTELNGNISVHVREGRLYFKIYRTRPAAPT